MAFIELIDNQPHNICQQMKPSVLYFAVLWLRQFEKSKRVCVISIKDMRFIHSTSEMHATRWKCIQSIFVWMVVKINSLPWIQLRKVCLANEAKWFCSGERLKINRDLQIHRVCLRSGLAETVQEGLMVPPPLLDYMYYIK